MLKLGNDVVVIGKCNFCKQEQTVKVTKQQLDRIKAGEHIQHVCPRLTADEREFLISGICGKCFDNMFGEDDE